MYVGNDDEGDDEALKYVHMFALPPLLDHTFDGSV